MANSRINENRRTYRTTDTALLVKTEMFETDQIYFRIKIFKEFAHQIFSVCLRSWISEKQRYNLII